MEPPKKCIRSNDSSEFADAARAPQEEMALSDHAGSLEQAHPYPDIFGNGSENCAIQVQLFCRKVGNRGVMAAFHGKSVMIERAQTLPRSSPRWNRAARRFVGTGDSAQYWQHRSPLCRHRNDLALNRPARVSHG